MRTNQTADRPDRLNQLFWTIVCFFFFFSHLSVPVRTSTAQNLHFLLDIMGTDSILKAGQPFNQRFLSAVSKMCVDPSAGVR